MKDMQNDIALSIIIPHYNNANLLKKTLLSIPDRDWIQVIVVDDHSDKLLMEYEEVKRDFTEKRGYLFLENPDKYAGTARNYGMKFATGKWLMFADSDDFFTENFEEVISRHLDDEEDLIYFTPVSVNIEEPEKKCYLHVFYQRVVEDYIISPNIQHEYALRFLYVVPWSKMIRRNIVNSNDIKYEASKHYEDILFSAKCGGYANKIKAVDEIVYCTTDNSNKMTKTIGAEDQKSIEEEYDKYCWWIKCHVGLKGRRAMGWSRQAYFALIKDHYKIRIKKFLQNKKTIRK